MNHKLLAIEDRLWLVAELEHQRRHCLRSARVAEDKEQQFFYLVKAGEAQDLRRRVMAEMGHISELDWCVVKSAMAIKQLNYETMVGEEDLFRDIESFADSLTGHAFNMDMSGCKACADDMAESQDLQSSGESV